jgi:hypothetical protein
MDDEKKSTIETVIENVFFLVFFIGTGGLGPMIWLLFTAGEDPDLRPDQRKKR